jgi:RNA polymerase sigma-70 factor (ECF subfamily)
LAKQEEAGSGEVREIRAIAAGDSAAFRRLIDREGPRLLRFARSLLGSLEEAEDVVQDTLIRLLENAATWTPDARIGTWLHRVCYNRSVDILRRRRPVADEGVLEALPESSDLPDAQLIEGETLRSLPDRRSAR